ncbi:Bug family tripartite tricarboxylate transporter substrate binding protein [Paracandidimonas soli]|uniref:Tripartite-type tricarboxylate transporter receptor subunit TctC n=1 Tax=Paracandidimonas soli TaxID=1917182 RepID=A0A4V2VPZ3_9BURK|nr:tripartite tricarboxylate transporter substrate-binding protein [Paracandidimonas soli]TCU92599.1 tripartite-type tricarboxylate transporter receptor subunit TctC [Paracandidimonas soli]
MKLIRSILSVSAGLLLSTSVAASGAFDFRGPIRVVVPFAAGGATDNIARVLAPGLEKELGKTVVVENRPGASGQIGVSYVKKAPADGSVLLLALDHSVVIVPLITPSADYDAIRDLTALGTIARFEWTFAVPNSSPAKTLQEFAQHIKDNPASRHYGVPLIGGMPNFMGKSVGDMANVSMEPIPFGGSGQLMPQLMGGQLASGVTGSPEGVIMHDAGKVRILAITGEKRSALLPDVPTFSELGMTDLSLSSFNAFFAPKGIPEKTAQAFNNALRKVLTDPNVRTKVEEMSMELVPSSTLESAKTELESTYKFWNSIDRGLQ